MDIHKPKPWHGSRELAREVGTIVIGVLIALAAEQGVEWLHWRHQVHGAREALKADYLRLILWSGERDAASPCISARLGEIAGHLEAGEATGRVAALGWINAPSRRPWTVRAWDGVVSSQVLSHFPQSEAMLAAANALYSKDIQGRRDSETQHWAVLQTLSGPARRLDAGELGNMRAVLGMAASEANLLRGNAGDLARQSLRTGFVSRAEAVKAWSEGAALGLKWPICQPLGAAPPGFAPAVTDPDGRRALGAQTRLPF